MIHQIHIRTLFITGLVVSMSCSFFRVEPEPVQDVPALKAHILNTQEWLHFAQAEYDAFQPLLKDEQAVNIKKKFRIYQRLKTVNKRMGTAIADVRLSLEKQKEMSREFNTLPGFSFLDSTGGFTHSLVDSFVTNKETIRLSQSAFLSGKKTCVKLFKKRKKRLIFIRDQIKPWQEEVADLALKHVLILDQMTEFEKTIGQAVFNQESERYKRNHAHMTQRLTKKIGFLTHFEKRVKHMVPIAKKEVGALVFMTPINDPKKDYENRYEQDLIRYKDTLKDLKKTFELL